ncbi:alkaline shock response membrane anchor protein AmaP [Saccharothrix xinjiangensis]|uniref:Alkaline shock response membrane anchor protein AmaP n=1 Tax=Saccharothrix xinjiangensis TaxID=204798 RepID=A0ABV9XZV9_9PSEU
MNRANRTERVMAAVVGLLALLTGVGALALHHRQVDRPVLDPVVLDWVRRHPTPVRVGLVVLGLLAVFLGLRWAWRAARPEAHPDLVVDERLVITAKALAAAVRSDAEQVGGVTGAKVWVVGTPALRLRLTLRRGADVRAVWRELDDRVLARARRALGVTSLPAAVRLDLGAEERERVR